LESDVVLVYGVISLNLYLMIKKLIGLVSQLDV